MLALVAGNVPQVGVCSHMYIPLHVGVLACVTCILLAQELCMV